MTLFLPAELPNMYGVLAAAGFADGSPAGHTLRELVRNGNQEKSRPGLAQHWVPDSDVAGDSQSRAVLWAAPYWQHVIPALIVPCPKKAGIQRFSVKVRATITLGSKVMWFLGTNPHPHPQGARISAGIGGSQMGVMDGTGAEQTLTLTAEVQERYDESLSLYVKHLVDPAKDPKMATGTYGTPNNGTVLASLPDGFSATGATWNSVALGGHYVLFETSSGRPLHVPSKVVEDLSATKLAIYPPVPAEQSTTVRGSTFTLYKSPGVELQSVAVSGTKRSP